MSDNGLVLNVEANSSISYIDPIPELRIFSLNLATRELFSHSFQRWTLLPTPATVMDGNVSEQYCILSYASGPKTPPLPLNLCTKSAMLLNDQGKGRSQCRCRLFIEIFRLDLFVKRAERERPLRIVKLRGGE